MRLYKRPGSNIWWVDFTDPNNRRVRQSTGTDDPKLAQEYADKLKHDSWRQSRMGEVRRKTFEEAAVKWLQDRALEDDKRTLDEDRAKLDWYVGTENSPGPLRGRYLDEIGNDLIRSVLSVKTGKGGRKLANGTFNRWMALVRSILRRAWLIWKHEDNVTPWLAHPPGFIQLNEGRGRKVDLPLAQAKLFLDSMDQYARDIYLFAMCCGQRRGNALWLKWEQVKMDEGRIAWSGDDMKNGEEHSIPINAMMKEILVRQMGKHPDFVFTHKGQPLSDFPRRQWAKATKVAGITIPGFRPHDLRHVWATILKASGVDDRTLQELGSWRNRAMVDRYANLNVEHLRGAADKIDEAMRQVGLSGSCATTD
jgi:integrase